ncbi:hypothetical protein MASR2M48_34780 [Spirochaetota bacterium]
MSFAALLSNFVPALAGLGTQSFVELGQRELADFVVDAAPLLGRFGVVLILPKELKSPATPRPALQQAVSPASYPTWIRLRPLALTGRWP